MFYELPLRAALSNGKRPLCSLLWISNSNIIIQVDIFTVRWWMEVGTSTLSFAVVKCRIDLLSLSTDFRAAFKNIAFLKSVKYLDDGCSKCYTLKGYTARMNDHLSLRFELLIQIIQVDISIVRRWMGVPPRYHLLLLNLGCCYYHYRRILLQHLKYWVL